MKKQTLSTDQKPTLLIQNIPGDLRITGGEQNEIKAKTNGNQLDFVEEHGQFTLACDADLILTVPQAAEINILTIGGDASLRSFSGTLSIKEIAGDLALRNIGAANLGEINGDFVFRHGKGRLNIAQIHGDTSIRDLEGDLHLGSLAKDLHLRNLQGGLDANLRGDAVLFIAPVANKNYQLNAGGDILLRLPSDADVELSLSAQGDLRHNLPSVVVDEERNTLKLGSATAKMTLSAKGDLLVTTKSDEWESLADFDISLPFIGADFPGIPDDLAERISRKVDASTRKATRKIDKAVRKSTRHTARKVDFPTQFFSRKQSAEPVSEDERLLILKMLQEKKITVEEAEKLLSALG